MDGVDTPQTAMTTRALSTKNGEDRQNSPVWEENGFSQWEPGNNSPNSMDGWN